MDGFQATGIHAGIISVVMTLVWPSSRRIRHGGGSYRMRDGIMVRSFGGSRASTVAGEAPHVMGAHSEWDKRVLLPQAGAGRPDRFTEWTPDGHLRHSKFVGLREDKVAKEVVREIEG